MHTREFGSHLTNVLRCLQRRRTVSGTVTELVGWEHSMKNEYDHRPLKKRTAARQCGELNNLMKSLGLEELRGRFYTPFQQDVATTTV
jgi:hypothetical protein